MKGNSIKILLTLAVLAGGLHIPSWSQTPAPDFIYGGIEDTETILQEYLAPYAHILGSDLNAGWYNSARPHELGGLDVTATVSWAKAPSSALSFDLADLDLNGTIVPNPGTTAPTVAGEQDDRPGLSYTQMVDMGGGNMQEVEYARITVPDGAGVDFFPLPMAQLTVGLPFGTDVSARFIPLIGYRDYGEIGLWGVGGRHSISQWLPVINKLGFLDISIQGGYTKVTSSVHVVLEPQELVEVGQHQQRCNHKYCEIVTHLVSSSFSLVSLSFRGRPELLSRPFPSGARGGTHCSHSYACSFPGSTPPDTASRCRNPQSGFSLS